MGRKTVVLVLFSAVGLLACGDIVDWIAGGYQAEDRSGAVGEPYVIIQAAPDSDQPRGVDLGTLVYLQAQGGERLGIRVVNGSFQSYPTSDGGASQECLDVLPLTPLLVQPASASEALLMVELLVRTDAGVFNEAQAPLADAAANEGGVDAGAITGCGAGFVAIRSAAAVISDTRVIVLDGGGDAANAAGSPPPEGGSDANDAGDAADVTAEGG